MQRPHLRKILTVGFAALIVLGLSAAGSRPVYVERGKASWYGAGFKGKRTASGDRFDPAELTAAHPDLPLGAKVTVINVENGLSAEVVINDRGPYRDGRIIDLSKAAAKRLDMLGDGVARVRVEATRVQLAEAEL